MHNKKKGILYIVLAAFSFATMSLFIQLAEGVPFIQKTFFRNIVSLVFAFVIIMRQGRNFSFKPENLKYLILRSVVGTLGIFFNFYAIEKLILADAAAIGKLAPFFVVLFSFIILKEKIKLWQFLSIVVAFLGSLFIVNPGLLLAPFTGVAVQTSLTSFPAFVGLLGAIVAGVAYTLIRKLSMRGERGPFIVFFFSAFSTVACIPFLLFDYVPMTALQFAYLMGAGLFASFGQFAITAAYSNAPAKDISIYDYSQIVFSALYGVIIFGQMPTSYSLLGYAVIVAVAIFMYCKGHEKKPA